MAKRIKARVMRTKGMRKGSMYIRYFVSQDALYKFLAKQRKKQIKKTK